MDWDVKIIKQSVAFLAGNKIRQISSTLCQMMKESGEGPAQDQIAGLLRPAGKIHNLA
jgi:hypothetical protein